MYSLDPSGCNDSEGHGDDRLHVNHVFPLSKPSQKRRRWNSMVRRGYIRVERTPVYTPFDPRLTRVYNMVQQDSVYYHNGDFVVRSIVKVKSGFRN